MSSQSRDTRENQKKRYDQLIQERRAELEKKGIKEVDKDKVYKHLRARQRAIVKAIAAIDAIKARNEQNKEAAVEQAAPAPAEPKEKKPKKEKPEKAAAPKASA
jgi:hypothetical protein